MNQQEATERAREFVRSNAGVDAAPDTIRLIADSTGRQKWRAFYAAAHFFPTDVAGGATIDGGEYIVDIDDETGQASLLA